MNNDIENEAMEEEIGEAEAAAVAQRAQEVVGEAAAHVAEGLLGGSSSSKDLSNS